MDDVQQTSGNSQGSSFPDTFSVPLPASFGVQKRQRTYNDYFSEDEDDEWPPRKISRPNEANSSDDEPALDMASDVVDNEDEEDTDVEEIFDNLSDNMHKGILANLCPDNMRGTSCRTPDACLRMGFYFACPDYAMGNPCKHEPGPFGPITTGYIPNTTHPGYKHTITGCDTDNEIDCKKTHPDKRPCRVEVTYWHVRAACVEMRGTGEKCKNHGAVCGHDHEKIRKYVMTGRRNMRSG